MITENGVAMFGKFGDAISPTFSDDLNSQIEQGIKTYLFLMTREWSYGKLVTFQCLLRRVHNKLDEKMKDLIPRYYAHKSHIIHTWFEIASIDRLTREEMNKIFVQDSGREIISVAGSKESIFRVCLSEVINK